VQPPAELAERHRCPRGQFPRGPAELRRVDPVEATAEGGAGQPLQRGLQHRPQRRAVGRRDQMDGAALERDADGGPVRDRVGQLARVERDDPRPERHVRVRRLLGLQADEVLDHVERGTGGALQQQLAPQQRTVEVPVREHEPDPR
jgi:hypothetical protein